MATDLSSETRPEAEGLALSRTGERVELTLSGAWTTELAARREAALAGLPPWQGRELLLDLEAVSQLDTAGAWLLLRMAREAEAAGLVVTWQGLGEARRRLVEKVAEHESAPGEPARPNRLVAIVERIGEKTVTAGGTARDLLNFLGLVTIALARNLTRPARLRFTSVVYHIERTGWDALPIVGLLSFLIGVVLAYQGADQLAKFGAQIFTVNLVGISVLREMGILITAIVVAGRSGSAFTAQIGTMQVREEVDAMRTIGLDPVDVLVVPRIVALSIALPLLTFYSDIMGILGGAMMSWIALDISPLEFLRRFEAGIRVNHFYVGLAKAPIFGYAIALVGCFEGLKVTGSAESVGLRTTTAVVEAIFVVILLDALFSIFFSVIHV
ncbi:phospholipid/cholesterol/gamma-HCH transport system permease protein [Tistlia consotensis]|uniref:Phospholipid/cholesterol/gamma-HCH transport system permease protein n=1 Tax=Tistlia consotensis USBA 355 TaxID=560819 RepID=A0A1Y6C0L4_9PROT|nr:MlaE family lipid ABC transporter permease subunit [Tistlia consotensis]SMF39237.1 phospholipid/cholesterol/gamma-HCH transport system permease protein [Tistlia consotensis USBA 355]SNR36500.1 phospholipid/cholesterol/gamma-HCH transport system permease protein [Tistlia consotensis]